MKNAKKGQSPCTECCNYIDYLNTEYGRNRCKLCNILDNQRLVGIKRDYAYTRIGK